MNETVPAAPHAEAFSPSPVGRRWLEISCWSVIALTAAGLAAGYVYYTIFSLFQPYDDEGFILISLKSFFQGKALYDEVYSSFQPGFYVLYWLLFKVTGAEVCHDHIRWVTLVLWLLAAALNGAITYRLSSSGLLALLVSLISVRCQGPFANEPGHPQTLAYVLVAGVVLAFTYADSISPRRLALAVGAMVGISLLIKINVGVFLLLPVGMILLGGQNGKVALSARLGIAILMIGLSVLLWRVQLHAKDVPLLSLCLLELLAVLLVVARVVRWRTWDLIIPFACAACVVVLLEMDTISVGALPVFSAGLLSLSICGAVLMCLSRSDNSESNHHLWIWASIGGLVVLGSVILITLERGTSFYGLANGLVWWPAKVSASFLIRLRSNWLGLCFGLVGAAGSYAFLCLRSRWGNRGWFQKSILVAQVSFGLATLAEFYARVQGSRTLMPLLYDLPHFWMLPFAWLVAVPQTGPKPSGRLSLLAITVMQPLIACPIAGTQLVPASLLIPVLGAVCLGDGLRTCFAQMRKLSELHWLRMAGSVVGTVILLWPFARETLNLRQQYAALTSFDLPGAHRIRLPESEVRIYHQVVAELSRPEVTTFLTLPGLYSFYFWADKEPPNALNVSAWIILLDNESQERIWQAAQTHSGLMVVRNRQLLRSWVGGRSIAELPLVRHIDENFKPVAKFGNYELLDRR